MRVEHRKSILFQALEIMRQATMGHPYRNQAELARASGISEANISRWLNGNVTPTLGKLEPVLLALGVQLVAPLQGQNAAWAARPKQPAAFVRKRRSATRHDVKKDRP